MEIELRSSSPNDHEIHSELRVWSSEKGEPVGEPIPIPLADIRVEVNATGERLLARGDHVAAGSKGSRSGTECQVRDAQCAEESDPPPRG